MKTLHEVIKHELIRQFPPPKEMNAVQVRVYLKRLDRASRAIIRAVKEYVRSDDNGHG